MDDLNLGFDDLDDLDEAADALPDATASWADDPLSALDIEAAPFTANYLAELSRLPGVQAEDGDADGVFDTVHVDVDGDGDVDWVESVSPTGATAMSFDATGDGRADVKGAGEGGDLTELRFPDDGSSLPLP